MKTRKLKTTKLSIGEARAKLIKRICLLYTKALEEIGKKQIYYFNGVEIIISDREHLVFLKKAEEIANAIEFGSQAIETVCPKDKIALKYASLINQMSIKRCCKIS